jgi:hypothetical protein
VKTRRQLRLRARRFCRRCFLNSKHSTPRTSGASKKIYRTLDALGRAVQGADAEKAWRAFAALDGPGDNFGTWAI